MRIGHISDVHLRHHLPGTANLPERRSREAPELLRRALQAMRNDGVELVAVTGDVVDVPGCQPAGSSREAWRAAVTQDYRLCRDILAAGGIPCVVVPGNHDEPGVMAEVFGMETGFRDFGGLRFVSFWDREHESHVPRRVGAEAALFDEMLAAEHAQVHLQHFVITDVPTTDYPYTYDNRADLLRRIVDSGRVRLCLSGHYHAGTEMVRIERTYFSTAPALAEYPHRYRTYEVSDTAISGVEHAVRRKAD